MAAGRLIVVQTNPVTADVAVGLEQGAKYALTGPDGTRAVFNDRSDPDFVGFLTAPPAGLDAPDTRLATDVLTEADGGTTGTGYAGLRPFGLDGIIDPTAGPLDYRETENPSATNGLPDAQGRAVAGWSTLAQNGPTAALAAVADADLDGYGLAATLSSAAASTAGGSWYPLFGSDSSLGQRVPVAPGDRVTLAGRLKVVTPLTGFPAGTAMSVSVRYTTAAGVYVASAAVGTIPNVAALAAGSLTDVLFTALVPSAPAGIEAAAFMVSVAYPTASTVAGVVRLGRMMVARTRPNETPPTFSFNGDTLPGALPQRTRWVGTAGASASVLYDVIRTPLESGAVTNRRWNRLQRASRARARDMRLEWEPQTAPPVRVTGRLVNGPRGGGRLPKTFSVQFVAPDPRIYGQAVKAAAGVIGPNPTNVQTDGNIGTPPVLTIRGAQGGALVATNQGKTVRVDLATVANDVLVIDFAAGTILLNGVNRYDALNFAQTAWWMLEPGLNPIVVNAASGAATWELSYRDAFE